MTQARPNRLASDAAFSSLERLRKHLKLRVEDVIQIVGVTRPTYYGWGKGRKINQFNEEKVVKALKGMLKAAQSHEWKSWENTHLTPNKRREILDGLLAGFAPPAEPLQ